MSHPDSNENASQYSNECATGGLSASARADQLPVVPDAGITSNDNALLRADGLRFGYEQKPDFLGPLSLSVQPGQCWAILGPNGAGKSTLLRLLAGLITPGRGTVSYQSAPLEAMSIRSRAKHIAFMPQDIHIDADMNVRNVVLMGRHPHRSMGMFESAEDFQIADDMMRMTQTVEFADRNLSTLSGGEAQRVHLAAALAQQPEVLLLDEPTASLDVRHQLSIFRILRESAAHNGLAVMVVTHDINLAAHYCSHVLLLDDGQSVASGRPAETLTPELLSKVYGVNMVTCRESERAKRSWTFAVESSEKNNS